MTLVSHQGTNGWCPHRLYEDPDPMTAVFSFHWTAPVDGKHPSICFNHPFGGAGFRWPIHSISIIWFMGTTMVVPNMLVICRHFSIRTNENPVPELDPFKCRKKRICYTEVLHIKKSPPWFQIPELRDRSKSRYQARNRKTLLPLK